MLSQLMPPMRPMVFMVRLPRAACPSRRCGDSRLVGQCVRKLSGIATKRGREEPVKMPIACQSSLDSAYKTRAHPHMRTRPYKTRRFYIYSNCARFGVQMSTSFMMKSKYDVSDPSAGQRGRTASNASRTVSIASEWRACGLTPAELTQRKEHSGYFGNPKVPHL